jgi:hypothetical protein
MDNQPFVRKTNDMLGYELRPSFDGRFKGASLRTNQWGMRDKEYPLVPLVNTYRIALLGSSYTMGAGVAQELTLEALVEDRLNREATNTRRIRYELLNFSVGGYGVLENVLVAERKVGAFQPNVVLIVMHALEIQRMTSSLVSSALRGTRIDLPYVARKLNDAGVRPGMLEPELRRRIGSVAQDLVQWSYAQIAESSRKRGSPLVGITFPVPLADAAESEQLAQVVSLASKAGFPILSLEGVYDARPHAELILRPTPRRSGNPDRHLNKLGHQMVADRLYELLKQNDARALRIGFPASR